MEYKNEVISEWGAIAETLKKYPQVFKPETVSIKLFKHLYAQVCTRCFGWGLPYCAMIPLADNLNHSDVSIMNEVVNKKLQLLGDEESSYFTRMKFMNNYREIFEDSDIKSDLDKINIEGRFNKANFELN